MFCHISLNGQKIGLKSLNMVIVGHFIVNLPPWSKKNLIQTIALGSQLYMSIVATPLWPSVGVKPNTSKVGDLESSGTPECLEFNSKAQNTSH
jgi:hypothetical protein